MPYTDVFSGSPVVASEVAYRGIALTASIDLLWPQEYVDTDDVVARIMDVTPSAGGYTITLDDARNVGVGYDTIWRNLGAYSFSVLDNAGGTICTVGAGQAYYTYIKTNSTAAGTWGTLQFGVGASYVDAASLAGAGLVAAAGLLNQSFSVVTKNSAYTANVNDRANLIAWTAGVGTLTLTAAATLGNNWFIGVSNSGSGALTVDPQGTIDGESSLTMNPGDACFIICGGTSFYTLGLGQSPTVTVSKLTLSVAGNTDVTLTSAQAANQLQEFTGTLTGNINVIEPTNAAVYWIYNNTTGAYTLTVKTSAGTGLEIAQGTWEMVACDGTDIIDPDEGGGGTVTSVATGTGLTGGPITGSGTISLANTAVTPGTYGELGFVVDAQGRLTSVNVSSGCLMPFWVT